MAGIWEPPDLALERSQPRRLFREQHTACLDQAGGARRTGLLVSLRYDSNCREPGFRYERLKQLQAAARALYEDSV